MTNITKTALAYAIGMIQSMPLGRQDDCPLHEMRTAILGDIGATDLADIVTDVEMQSGKAVHLYRDYMESHDPADILFKATYDQARGLKYAELIRRHEEHPPIFKAPDPATMAKRAQVCLDHEMNIAVVAKAHDAAVNAIMRLCAVVEESTKLIEAAAAPQKVEAETALNAWLREQKSDIGDFTA